MPITTDTYYNIEYNDQVLDRMGLSKTLDNYTLDEINDYTYVGSSSFFGRQMTSKSLSGYTYVGFSQLNGSCPFAANFHSGTYETIDIEDGQTEDYNLTDNGLYRRVLLLHAVNGQYADIINDVSNYKIITEFDAPKYTIDLGNKSDMLFENTPYWFYDNIGGSTAYNTNLGKSNNVQLGTCGFAAYVIIPFNNTYYIMRATLFSSMFNAYSINNSNMSHCSDVFTDYSGNNPAAISETVIQWFKNYNFTDEDPTPIAHPLNTSIDYWAPYDGYCSLLRFSGGAMGFFQYFLFTDETKLMTFLAGAYGLHFIVDGTIYKPIITDNFVVGYSSDLNITSDLDNYVGSTKHDLPVNPPGPPAPVHPSGDIETDMPLAYIGGTAGMVDFIKINAAGLASADDIADSISRFDITTIGKDLLRNFVAFKCYAVLDIDDSVVRDIKVAGHILKDENDNALQGEYIGGVAPVDFSAGKIEPLYNDFRDYAPYTRIQMYVPFCGWFDLPSWCMGKEITGTMFTDIYNGTVKAVIYASRTVVAEVGGCCAFDIPFAAESTGMKAGAVISSALNTVAMTGATVAAPNIATGIAAVSSAANFISAANSNGTTLKGVMGDGSNTNGLLHVYIKTTRPNSPDGKREIPERYKHEYGIPCFKQLTLTAGDGFTQIMDANIEGTMTDREKQMIIDGFRHGLIL